MQNLKQLVKFTILFFWIGFSLNSKTGTLDRSFGKNGITMTDIKRGDYANAIALQPDGKILVAGESASGSGSFYISDFAIVRYKPDGTLDTSFGSNGITTTDINSRSIDVATAIALQPDGKILVAGYSGPDDYFYTDFAIVRYNPDGTLDTSFGSNGITTTGINSNDKANAIALQPDGKILVAGYSGPDYFNTDFAIVRYNPDGTLDTSFGSSGIATKDIYYYNSFDQANALALKPDGKILVAGYSYWGSQFDFAIVRYNPDGTLDRSFGKNGITMTYIKGDDIAADLALQPDGKILVAGSIAFGSGPDYISDFAIVRYKPDGTLDTSFGSDGIATKDIKYKSEDKAYAIALQSDGKILVAGYSGSGSNSDFAIVRYNADGTLDTSFGSNGITTTDIKGDDVAYAIALQPDGKILVAGYSGYSGSFGNTDFAIVRYK